MAMISTEVDFVGNAGEDSVAYMVYDPNIEEYKWFKVISGVKNEYIYIYFTPDGSKVLAYATIGRSRTFIFMDPNSGAQLGATDL